MAAPQITTNFLRIVEGQTIRLSLGNLDATVEDVSDGDILFTIQPVAGDPLSLSGSFLLTPVGGGPSAAVTEFTLADIQAGRVQFAQDGTNDAPQYTVVASIETEGIVEASESDEPDINFVPFNDAPIFLVNALSITEGGTVVLNSDPANPNLVTEDEESSAAEISYEIRTVANGTFQRIGGASPTNLVVGDTFTQAEVDSGLIQFQHDGSETAPTYRLRVTDGGIPEEGNIPAGGGTRTVTLEEFIQINDAPTITQNSLTVTEDGQVAIGTQNLAATDVEDDDGELQFTITSISNGRFELLDAPGGTVVSTLASPETEPIPFSQNAIFQGLVRFVNDPGTDTPPTYTVQVSDLGTPAETDTSEADIAFTAINDLPVLVNLGLALEEGEQVPLSSENLLVTDEETDASGLTYSVTSTTAGNFVLQADGSVVTEFTQADIDAGTVIAFQQDGSNTAPSFSLQVTDSGGEAIVIDSGDAIAFGLFNDPPEVQRAQLSITEGQALVLSSDNNLLVTDEETEPGNLVYAVDIVSADPENPDIFIVNGVEQTGTATFTQLQVNAGQVQFVHGGSNFPPNLSVTVTDTAISDTDTPNAIPVELDISFTATNDEPIFSINTLSIAEGGTVVLNSAETNLLTTDEETDPTQLVYTITSVSNGEFQRIDGPEVVALVEGDTFTQADVDSNAIQFVQDGSDLAPDYTLTVTDTGVNDDPATAISVSRSVTIPEGGFTSINDAPELLTNSLTLTEGDVVTLSEANLSATDSEDDDGALIFTITDLVNGRFERTVAGGEPETVTTFTQEEVQLGLIQFVNDPAINEPPSYTVTVSDLDPENPLTASGAAEVFFTGVNDAPVFETNTLTIAEGETVILNSDVANPNLVAMDEETPPEALTYTIDSVSNGEFQLVGGETPTPIAVGGTFTQADVDAGLIQFAQDGSELPPDYSLTVTDTGINEDPTTILSATLPLTIPDGGFTNLNDAPELINNTLTLTEGAEVVLTSENLSATDVEDDDTALLFTITDLVNGRFERVTPGEMEDVIEVLASPDLATPIPFTQGDIAQGLIRFVNDPATDEPPSYTVTVSDLDPENPLTASGEAEIFFTAVDDEPVLEQFALTLTEDDTVPLTAEILSVVDEEATPENVVYTVDAVTGGRFVRTADDTDATSFTQAEIDAGTAIAFEQDGGNDAPTFSLTVSDGVNTLTVTEESGEGLTFTPINDAPVVEASTLAIEEGVPLVLSAENLRTVDEESSPLELVYNVTIANADTEQPDVFEINGEQQAGPDITFTQAQVNAGLVTFIQGGSNSEPEITMTVTDTFDPEFGEPITVPVDLTVELDTVNDLPEVVNNTLTISEGATVTLTPDNLLTTDEETPPEELTYSIEEVANGNFQTFDVNLGTVTGVLEVGGTFTQADIDNGTVQFVQDGSEVAPAYTLKVTDTALSPEEEPNSVLTTVDIPEGGFTSINDDPVLGVNTLTVTEGQTVVLTAANLSATDPDSPVSQLRFQVSEVIGGTFLLKDVALSEGQTFSTTNISFGEVAFEDDGDEVPPSYTVTVLDPAGGTSEPAAAEIVFTEVNDPPTIVTNAFSIVEGERLTLNEGGVINLLAEDAESMSDADIVYTVSNVTGGEFLDFTATPITTFTQAALNNGDINFVPDGSEEAPTFDITVTDADGAEVTVAANIVAFTPVNDPPTLVNNQISVTEGGTTTLSTDNFSAEDVDSTSEELTFTISDLVGGQFVVAGQTVGGGDGDGEEIPAGTFSGTLELTEEEVAIALGDGLYINLHTQNFPNGELRGQIDLEAEDTTASGVLEEAQEVGTVVPDGPATGTFEATLTGTTLSVSGTYSGLSSPLAPVGGVDAAGNPESAVHVHVGAAGENGPILQNLGVTETGDDTPAPVLSFTQAQLEAEEVQFVDDGDEVAPTFSVSVSDGEFDTEPVPVTITEFINTNDPPIAVDDAGDGFGTDQNTVFTTASVLLNDEDVDGDVLSVTEINGEAVSAGAVTLESGAFVSFAGDGTFSYDPNGQFAALVAGETATDSFEYTVSDPAGETASAIVTIEIDGVDDAPILETNRLSISLGQTLVLSALNLVVTDVDTPPTDLLITVSGVTGGDFLVNGEEADSFTQQDILDGAVSFVQDGTETPPSYDVAVTDGTNVIEPTPVTLEQFVPINIDAIEGGFFDYGQFLRLLDPETAVIPADEVGGIPLAQIYDEQYYLDQNPDVAEAVAAGVFTSGYQHFVTAGLLEGRDPSILYDNDFYLERSPDVAAVVEAGGFASGLQHFLLFGADELRNASPFFSQSDYIEDNEDILTAINSGAIDNGFEHYVLFGIDEQRSPQLALFNSGFYLATNPDVADAVAAGGFTDAYDHFVSFGQTEGRPPSILYNNASYLAANPDVAEAVAARAFTSGFDHYARFGRVEDRVVFA